MLVAPPVVGREQLAQRCEQVSLTTGARLDHGQAGGRVRHPQVQQSIAGLDPVEKVPALVRQIGYLFPRAGLDANLLGMHAYAFLPYESLP
jgi:hypothetical protein